MNEALHLHLRLHLRLAVLLVAVALVSAPTLGGVTAGGHAVADGPARLGGQPSTVAVTEPSAPPSLDLPARLAFGPEERVANGSTTPALSIGPALAADAARVDANYRVRILDERLAEAGSDTERRVVLRETRDEYAASIIAFRQRERAAALAYLEGSASARDVLAELAMVHRHSLALETSLEHLEQRADGTPGLSLSGAVDVQRTELATLRGPVRDRVVAAQRGTAEPIQVTVATSESGIVLASVQDGEYVREAVRFDNWEPGGEPTIGSLTEAIQRTESLYPWAFAEERGSRVGYTQASEEAYRATSEFAEGSVQIYLDRSTGQVYREDQALRLERIDTREAGTDAVDDVTMAVYVTYPGGPARIDVRGSPDDRPLNATVRMNGRLVGATGEDGSLWTVAPYAGSTSVEATVGDADVGMLIDLDREPVEPGSS